MHDNIDLIFSYIEGRFLKSNHITRTGITVEAGTASPRPCCRGWRLRSPAEAGRRGRRTGGSRGTPAQGNLPAGGSGDLWEGTQQQRSRTNLSLDSKSAFITQNGEAQRSSRNRHASTAEGVGGLAAHAARASRQRKTMIN